MTECPNKVIFQGTDKELYEYDAGATRPFPPIPRYGWLARLRCFLFGHPFKPFAGSRIASMLRRKVDERFMHELGIPIRCKRCGRDYLYTFNLRQYTVKG